MSQKSKKRLKESRKRIEDDGLSTLHATDSEDSPEIKRLDGSLYTGEANSDIETDLDIDSDSDLEPGLNINNIKVPSLEAVDVDIRKYIDDILYINSTITEKAKNSRRYIRALQKQKKESKQREVILRQTMDELYHKIDYYRQLNEDGKYSSNQKKKNVEKKIVSNNKSIKKTKESGTEILKERSKILQKGGEIEKMAALQSSKQNSSTRTTNNKDKNTSKCVAIVSKDEKKTIPKTKGINNKAEKYDKKPKAPKPPSDAKEPKKVKDKQSLPGPAKNIQPKLNKDSSRKPIHRLPLESRSSSDYSPVYSSSFMSSASYEILEEIINTGSPRRLVGAPEPYSRISTRTHSSVRNASCTNSQKSPYKREEPDLKPNGDVSIQMEAMPSTELHYIHNQDLTQKIIKRVRDPQKNFTLPQIRSSSSVDSRDSPMKSERKLKNVRAPALPNMLTIIPATAINPTPPSSSCRILRPYTGKPKNRIAAESLSDSLSDRSFK